MTIAQRFNAGWGRNGGTSPEGTADLVALQPSLRDLNVLNDDPSVETLGFSQPSLRDERAQNPRRIGVLPSCGAARLHDKTICAVRVSTSLINDAVGIGIERTGDRFLTLFLRRDIIQGPSTLLNPTYYHREPVHVACAGSAAAMQAARNHEQPAVLAGCS